MAKVPRYRTIASHHLSHDRGPNRFKSLMGSAKGCSDDCSQFKIVHKLQSTSKQRKQISKMKSFTKTFALLALALFCNSALAADDVAGKQLRGGASRPEGDKVPTKPSSLLGFFRRFLQGNGASVGSVTVRPAGGGTPVTPAGTPVTGTSGTGTVLGAVGDSEDSEDQPSVGTGGADSSSSDGVGGAPAALPAWTCPPGQHAKLNPEEGTFFCSGGGGGDDR